MAKYLDYEGLAELVNKLKDYVNGEVSSIDLDLFVVVDSLPEEGKPNKIYLVPGVHTETNNIYIEYGWVNETWEKLGEVQLDTDLSNFYTKSEVDKMIEDVEAGELKSLEGYATKEDIESVKGELDTRIAMIEEEADTAHEELTAEIGKKQDALTAGEGIKIEDNIISADIDLSGYETKEEADTAHEELTAEIGKKQDALTTYSEEVVYAEDGSVYDSEARIKTYSGGEKNFVDMRMRDVQFRVGIEEGGNTLCSLELNDGSIYLTGDGNVLKYNGSDILYEAHASWQDLLARVAALEEEAALPVTYSLIGGEGSGSIGTDSGEVEVPANEVVTGKCKDISGAEGDVSVMHVRGDVSIEFGHNRDGNDTLEDVTLEYSAGYSANWSYLFENYTNLKNVTIVGGSPTAVYYMFNGCGKLSCANIRNMDYSKCTDTLGFASMFSNCGKLMSLNVAGWDTSAIHNMQQMFYGCESLEEIAGISDFATGNVTNFGNTFNGCKSLKKLELNNWDTGANTILQYTFRNCESLETLEISGWNTGGVTTMLNCFDGCKSLTALDINGWDVSQVTSMDMTFRFMENVQVLDLANWDVSKVTTMFEICYGCTNMTEFIMDGWNFESVTDFNMAFNGCTSLTTIGEYLRNIKADISFKDSPLNNDSAYWLITAIWDYSEEGGEHTLTLSSTTKERLADSQIAEATAKGWTIA